MKFSTPPPPPPEKGEIYKYSFFKHELTNVLIKESNICPYKPTKFGKFNNEITKVFTFFLIEKDSYGWSQKETIDIKTSLTINRELNASMSLQKASSNCCSVMSLFSKYCNILPLILSSGVSVLSQSS